MIETQSIILKIYVTNFPIHICHQIPDEFKVQKQLLKKFAIFTGKHLCWCLFLIKLQASRLATLLKRDSNTCVFLWILQTLRTPTSKNICERLLLIAVTYCIENWIKLFRNQILLKHKITLFYLHSFVFIRFNTRCHSPSLIVIFSDLLVVIRCQSLSFVVTCCITRCTIHCHSLSFVVTRCLSFYKRSLKSAQLFFFFCIFIYFLCVVTLITWQGIS